jgi:Rv0078B-related antitoxin
MDALKAESVREHREARAVDRLMQALELMADGFMLKRANLRRQYPGESEQEIDARFAAWMADG